MRIGSWPIALLFPLAAACGGSSPTAPAPPPAPALTLDQTALVVARHETAQLHALFGVPGVQQDVTATATWTSSNPGVATVNAGLVTVVDIGTASVTADYQGQRQVVAITARRRTRLIGNIVINDANGRQTIQSMVSYVDDREAGDTSVSHARTSWNVQWGGIWEWAVDPVVNPGSHTVSVEVYQNNPPNSYASDPSSQVTVQDIDTGQSLAVIPLPVESATLENRGKITWTVQVGVFSS